MERKPFLLFILTILILCFSSGCERPQLTGVELEKIDTSQDPIQKLIHSSEPIIIEFKNSHFTLTPIAEYKLSGMVVGRKTYSDDWEGKISPIDLAIAWGKLAEPEYRRYITYRQGNRWYFYQYKPGSPFDHAYVIPHSSNNHIIPGNKNIALAVKTIQRKNTITIEGLLVNLMGTYKGQMVTWNTSLSRTDTGNGSCELFYVTKVRIDTKVYE
jgi:hypothetical protein